MLLMQPSSSGFIKITIGSWSLPGIKEPERNAEHPPLCLHKHFKKWGIESRLGATQGLPHQPRGPSNILYNSFLVSTGDKGAGA
jgi:hypothetical protein